MLEIFLWLNINEVNLSPIHLENRQCMKNLCALRSQAGYNAKYAGEPLKLTQSLTGTLKTFTGTQKEPTLERILDTA